VGWPQFAQAAQLAVLRLLPPARFPRKVEYTMRPGGEEPPGIAWHGEWHKVPTCAPGGKEPPGITWHMGVARGAYLCTWGRIAPRHSIAHGSGTRCLPVHLGAKSPQA
jgi:hypothetical protein